MIPEEAVRRFWKRVNKGLNCWQWLGCIVDGGYGQIRVDGKMLRTHRVSWEIENGPIPDNLVVCHKCDNPPCVCPEHLFLGTIADNNRDCIEKGRGAWAMSRESMVCGERSPHAKLHDEDVRRIRTMHRSGMSCVAIAKHYPVHPATISKITRRIKWAHVE